MSKAFLWATVLLSTLISAELEAATRAAETKTASQPPQSLTSPGADATTTSGQSAAISSRPPRAALVLGARIGPSFSLSSFDVYALPTLELGVRLPFLGGRLEPFFTAGYTRPSIQGSGEDPHLSGGTWTYDLVQEELLLALGVSCRLWGLERRWSPYLGVGPQLVLERSVVNGALAGTSGGEPLGENREQYSRLGLVGHVGLEGKIGPGAAFVEIDLTWSRFDGVVTGSSANTAITPYVGYRLAL